MFFLSHVNSLTLHEPTRASKSDSFALSLLFFNFVLVKGEIFALEMRPLMGPFPILTLTDECTQSIAGVILRGEDLSPRRIICPTVTLSSINPTRTAMRLKEDVRGEKPIHCTAQLWFYSDSRAVI